MYHQVHAGRLLTNGQHLNTGSGEYIVATDRLVTFRHDDNTVVWGATARILYRCLQCLSDFEAEDDEPWDRKLESDL